MSISGFLNFVRSFCPRTAVAKEPESCSICLQELQLDNEITKAIPCQHLFHEACISPWRRLNPRCPLCQCNITVNNPLDEEQKRSILGVRRAVRPYFHANCFAALTPNKTNEVMAARKSGVCYSMGMAIALRMGATSEEIPGIFFQEDGSLDLKFRSREAAIHFCSLLPAYGVQSSVLDDAPTIHHSLGNFAATVTLQSTEEWCPFIKEYCFIKYSDFENTIFLSYLNNQSPQGHSLRREIEHLMTTGDVRGH